MCRQRPQMTSAWPYHEAGLLYRASVPADAVRVPSRRHDDVRCGTIARSADHGLDLRRSHFSTVGIHPGGPRMQRHVHIRNAIDCTQGALHTAGASAASHPGNIKDKSLHVTCVRRDQSITCRRHVEQRTDARDMVSVCALSHSVRTQFALSSHPVRTWGENSR